MEQRQWAALALEGDRTARAQLFEQNIEPIYYLCWKLTGSAAQAGELTRRTFSRAFSNLSDLRPDIGFDRWVSAIAVNLCRQTLKKAQPWLFTTSEKEMAALRDTYLADEACLPPNCPEDPELRSLALRTIGLLPPEQRVCMVLRYVALLKPHQIARTMEVDEVTVLGRLNSARRALMAALPSTAPQALVTALFLQEAAALPVPELLRGSCMQTVLSAQPEAAPVEEPEPAPEPSGFLERMTKKQKYLFFGGIGVAVFVVLLILILALRGCSKEPENQPAPEPEPAPMEEIDEDLESAALLEQYGVEMLLTCTRRDAEAQIEAWQTVLPDYITSGTVDDLDLRIESSNDTVVEVCLKLTNTDLDITRLRGLGLGSEPELSATADAVSAKYDLKCYKSRPLFDPVEFTDSSLAAYSENYRYELLDNNDDGRAEALSITRTGAGYDPGKGIFMPYGSSLTELLGLNRADAERLLGEGSYEDGGIDLYIMHEAGAAADGSQVSIEALMQARGDMDAAHQHLSAITLRVDGCFAELVPELQLPDASLTLDQLNRKLQAMSGHLGLLDGDVFDPLALENGQECLVYYSGVTRYLFCADANEAKISSVEILDLSDCKLYDSAKPSFQTDGLDLEKLLGMDLYEAYARYGIRSYATADLSSTALGLWDVDSVIRTVHNGADPRPLFGIKLGDSRETIEKAVEAANGYCCEADDTTVRYVLPSKRELSVIYGGDTAATLQLEDHSYQSDYTPPKPLTRPAKELFTEYLATLTDGKASWIGDLTHDGEENLVLCRATGSGCLLQLYVVKDNEVSGTPVYSQTITPSAATNVYVIDHESGPCLLFYTLSDSAVARRCAWRLVSINAAGSEVVLEENDASVNLLDIMLGSQEEYDNAKAQADGFAESGKFLCGTQSGSAEFADEQ